MKLRTLCLIAIGALALSACELEGEGLGVGTLFPDAGTDVTTDTGTTVDTGVDTGTDTTTGPIACNTWAGTGTCVSTATCAGITEASSSCNAGQTCCYSGALPSCSIDGNSGRCTYTSDCGAGYESERGSCGGPSGVECCYREPETTECTADGIDGVCIDVASCGGVSTPGECSGGSDIQCCTEVDTCEVSGVAGICIHVDNCDDGRETTSGLCPGSNDIRCCHDPVETTGCSSDQFQCDNGDCIAKSAVCDRANTCGDYSDEFGCSTTGGEDCGSSQLACPEMCISSSKACNGTSECAGGYDEKNCD